MQLELVTEVNRERRERKQVLSLQLTDRDYEILRFLIEMKFARIDELHVRFFRRNQDNSVSDSNIYAWERLSNLKRFGFIGSIRHFDSPKSYYLPTFKAYHAVLDRAPDRPLCKPLLNIDIRTFNHDLLVLTSRLELESTQGVSDWLSDRLLRSALENCFGLTSLQVPDGIYRLPDGMRVAFELEIAQKAKVRYRDKIQAYIRLIRACREDPNMFKRVHYRVYKKCVFDFLKAETRVYGPIFDVELAVTCPRITDKKSKTVGGVL